MPSCAQCGTELDAKSVKADEPVCEKCRQRDFATRAEEEAFRGRPQEFIVTDILLAMNIGLYVWMVFFRHVSPTSPSTEQIIAWGGNYGPLTLGTEPWRLFTSMFVHIGFMHLLANMWGLFVLGRLAESLYGRWSYLATYLLAGFAGSVASLLWNPMNVSAGASGAIFGIVGALITTFVIGKLPLPRENIRQVLVTLVVFAGFDLLYGIWKEEAHKAGVDNAAHIGGLIAGLALGLLLGHHLGPSAKARRFRGRVFIGALVLVSLFAGFVWKKDGYIPDVERARILISQGVADEGIRQLQVAAARRPNEPHILLLMGDAYLTKKDFPKAESAYKRVSELEPTSPLPWKGLALVYTGEEKFADSAAAWTHVAELSKNNGGLAWFYAGQMYSRMDKQEDAIKAYQKAVALAPNSSEIWAGMGFAQLKAGHNAEAVTSLERAVKLQPANPDWHLILGNAYLAAGREQEAQEQFFQSSKLRAAIQEKVRQLLQQRQNAKPAPGSGGTAPMPNPNLTPKAIQPQTR